MASIVKDEQRGTYTVRSMVDPYGFFLEESEGNNCTWARIRIPATGSTVTQLSSGWGCTLPGAGPTLRDRPGRWPETSRGDPS